MNRFQSITVDVERDFVYDNGHVVDRLSAVGSWINRWVLWNDRGAVLPNQSAGYDDIFLHFEAEEVSARRLALFLERNLELDCAVPVTHSVDYVDFCRS